MNLRRHAAAVVALTVLSLIALLPRLSWAADPVGCGSGGGGFFDGDTSGGSVGVSGTCSVQPTDLPGEGGTPVLVVDCGYATQTDDHTYWNKECGPTGFPCPAVPGNPNPHQFMTVFALTQPPVPIAAWCAGT